MKKLGFLIVFLIFCVVAFAQVDYKFFIPAVGDDVDGFVVTEVLMLSDSATVTIWLTEELPGTDWYDKRDIVLSYRLGEVYPFATVTESVGKVKNLMDNSIFMVSSTGKKYQPYGYEIQVSPDANTGNLDVVSCNPLRKYEDLYKEDTHINAYLVLNWWIGLEISSQGEWILPENLFDQYGDDGLQYHIELLSGVLYILNAFYNLKFSIN